MAVIWNNNFIVTSRVVFKPGAICYWHSERTMERCLCSTRSHFYLDFRTNSNDTADVAISAVLQTDFNVGLCPNSASYLHGFDHFIFHFSFVNNPTLQRTVFNEILQRIEIHSSEHPYPNSHIYMCILQICTLLQPLPILSSGHLGHLEGNDDDADDNDLQMMQNMCWRHIMSMGGVWPINR